MNLPNALTVIRIFLVPLLLVVLLTTHLDSWRMFGISKEVMGASIFAIASLTDWLDGYLARRRKQVTGFGQWMDPLADKLLITAALVALVSMDLAPAWMVAVILGREFYVTVLRAFVHGRGQSLPASMIGKVKLVAQVTAVLLLMLSRPRPEFFVLGHLALWVATIAALVSAIDYSRRLNLLSIFGARPAPAPKPTAVLRPAEPEAEVVKRVSA